MDTSDLDIPAVQWPVEEATFIALALARDDFYRELRVIVDEFVAAQGTRCERALLDDVFAYQRARVVNPSGPAETELTFAWNLPAFYRAAMLLEPEPLERRTVTMRVRATTTYATLRDFAQLQVWYGRQGKRFYYDITDDASPHADTAAAFQPGHSDDLAVPTIST